MAFKRLTFGRDWTKETDFPTYQDSEEQVRADLQYHPNALRDFINGLLDELEARTASESVGALNGDAVSTVQSVLNAHAEQMKQLADDIRTVSGGGVPSVIKSSTVTFSAESWAVIDNAATLTIPQSDHKRESAGFGYNLYQLVGGVYRGGTWAAAATRVTYNSGGSVTLTADAAYTGKIVFFGM